MGGLRSGLREPIVALLLLVGPVLWGSKAFADIGPPPVLNPKTYVSPSGVYRLFVDPSDRHGRFHATYRLERGREEVWSATFPFTLWEAGVTDSGIVAGYAYTHGPDGFGEGGYQSGRGDFHSVIFDPTGKPRLNEITKRQDSRYLHTSPNPLANGLIVDGPNDRMVIRVTDSDVNRRVESWWVYRLSTGESFGRLNPKKEMPDNEPAQFVIDAKPVVGTPLILVHWWRYARGNLGGRFTLVNPKGKTVWSFDLPKDYTIPHDEDAQYRLMDRIRKTGAILRTDEPGKFELHFVADAQRVAFRATPKAAGGWTVSEVAREKYVEPSPPPVQPVAIPERPLKYLGPLTLQIERKEDHSPIRGVRDFVIDGKGRLAFLRDEKDKPASFVVVDQMGNVIHDIPLHPIDAATDTHWSGFAWVGGERYVITRSHSGVGGMAKAWWVDTNTARVAPIKGFESPSVRKIEGSPEARFVILASMHQRFTIEDTVLGFDADGQLIWKIQQDYGGAEGTLFSPEDVAVTSDGTVAVLDNIQHTIQLYNRDGKYQKTLQLETLWRRTPNYPTEIAADMDQGFIVRDFSGTPPIVRLRSDGTIRSEFQPKHADGRVVETPVGVKAAPDGRLWTCDGHSLLRLTDAGVVDLVLGEAPNLERLGKPAALAVDGADRLYVVDSRTGAVHVFDRDGRRLRVCRPSASDFSGDLWDPGIAVTDDGDVYLQRERTGEYLHFSPSGARLDIERLDIDTISQRWYIQPGTGNRWVIGYEDVFLVAPSGAVLKTISRGADGNWLEFPQSASVAPDGSIAVIAGSSLSKREEPVSVNLFTADGIPTQSFALPSLLGPYPRIAYDAKKLVLAGEGYVVLYDPSGAPLQMCKLTAQQEDDAWWYPHLAAGGRELLLLSETSGEIHRYEMP